ncbi:MAG TPA: hypothetical protein VEQ85_08300, partial [Lacipirellulaceae bacterium]|nr:hypothetical protein [Lacipirellulaceae bacterium]
HQIAAYAELAAPDQVGPERLVAMLIRVSHRDEAPATGVPQIPEGEYSAVTQASAVQNREAYRPQSPAPGEAAAAEREPGRVFSWRPFERLRNREHTIVTSRRLLRRPLLNRD